MQVPVTHERRSWGLCPVFYCIASSLPVLLFSRGLSLPFSLLLNLVHLPLGRVHARTHTHTHTHTQMAEIKKDAASRLLFHGSCQYHSWLDMAHGCWSLTTIAYFEELNIIFSSQVFLFICSFGTHVISLKHLHYFLFFSVSVDRITMTGISAKA